MSGIETPYKIQLQIAESKLNMEQGTHERSTMMAVGESAYRFFLGAIAGGEASSMKFIQFLSSSFLLPVCPAHCFFLYKVQMKEVKLIPLMFFSKIRNYFS